MTNLPLLIGGAMAVPIELVRARNTPANFIATLSLSRIPRIEAVIPTRDFNSQGRNVLTVVPSTSFSCTKWKPKFSLRGLLIRQPSSDCCRFSCAAKLDLSYGSSLEFASLTEASKTGNVVPVCQKLFLQLTSSQVLSCLEARTNRPTEILVQTEPRTEHVNIANNAGVFTVISGAPSIEVKAEGVVVTLLKHKGGIWPLRTDIISEDPVVDVLGIARAWQPAMLKGLPKTFCGGWVDLINRTRTGNSSRIHIGLIDEVVVIDHEAHLVYAIHWVNMDDFATPELACDSAAFHMNHLVAQLHLATGSINNFSTNFISSCR